MCFMYGSLCHRLLCSSMQVVVMASLFQSAFLSLFCMVLASKNKQLCFHLDCYTLDNFRMFFPQFHCYTLASFSYGFFQLIGSRFICVSCMILCVFICVDNIL